MKLEILLRTAAAAGMIFIFSASFCTAGNEAYVHVGYQPYKLGNPDNGTGVPAWGSYSYSDVLADMKLIRGYFTAVRTWTIQYSNRFVVQAAHAAGVKVAMGAWGFPNNTPPAYFDRAQSLAEIDAVVAQAKQYPGTVTAIICGNENLQDAPNPNGLTMDVIKGLMTYARQKLNAAGLSAVKVGTCQTDGVWIGHGALAAHADCDTIFANIYPFWHGDSAGDLSYFQNMFSQVTGVAHGKPVVVGETGWATKGSGTWWGGTCTPGVANAKTYFDTVSAWLAAQKKEGYLFEMFDEPWKYSAAKDQESHFGIVEGWNSNSFKYPVPPISPAEGFDLTVGELRTGARCNIAVALREAITQPFDYYLLAETPAGIYTIYPDGSVEAGIHPLYRHVPGAGAHIAISVETDVGFPRELAGREVAFYSAAVESGATPPVSRLSEISENTPGIIQFDRETGTVQ